MGRELSRSFVGVCALALFSLSAVGQTQRVFLDFNSGTDGSINYTTGIKSAVQSELELIYSYWDIEFSQTQPAAPFSKLTFNSGFSGGLAQHVDFRNLIADDTAVVNVDGFLGTTPSSPAADITTLTTSMGAHELGHLLGVRHGDSYGPIGSGIGDPGPPAWEYWPAFPGPSGADETNNHVMATPAFGATNLQREVYFSERSATKIQFANSGVVLNEAAGSKGSLATAQAIAFSNMTVPNTIQVGANAGPHDFSVDAVSVVGQLSTASEVDFFRFEASSGDLFNFSVMSQALQHRVGFSTFNSQLSLLDSSGSLIDYWSSTSFNDDEYETPDSILIDISIPSDGTYYLQVNSHQGNSSGDYELFGYRFNGGVTGIDGDFDNDGDYDGADVDSLVAGIVAGNNGVSFDLTGDGIVDSADLDVWLVEAGRANLVSGDPYNYGDANLDGAVDVTDFNIWRGFQFTMAEGWTVGDFNADGAVDAGDFNTWNNNKFSVSDSRSQAVPEPSTGMLVLLSVLGGLVIFRK